MSTPGKANLQKDKLILELVQSGHPKFKDDTIISSSRIISVDTDNMRVKTVHSLYILGEPNPNWIEIFPDYMKVFDNFTKETLK